MLQLAHKDVEVIQVVRTTLGRAGEGVKGNPYRTLTQYWTLDGDLLATVDHWVESRNQVANLGSESQEGR